MDKYEMRDAYERWCKENRKRKSEAGWELWQAACESVPEALPGFHRLPLADQQRIRKLYDLIPKP